MLNHPSASRVLLSTLNSWRFICGLSILAYLSLLLLLLLQSCIPVLFIAGTLTGLVCQFYCWRLYLDSQLFIECYRPDRDLSAFDNALVFLWGKNATERTIESRWNGAKRLIYWAGALLLLQWAWLILAVLLAS